MKKSVIICMTSMYLGGAEQSLIGLLEAFDYEKYDVSLFLFDQSGELMNDIPKEVHILPEIKEYKALEKPISYAIKNSLWAVAAGRTIGKYKTKEYSKRFKNASDIIVGIEYKQKYTKRFLPVISDIEYDLAISFMVPHYVAAEKIKAKTKLAWVHTDYSEMHLDIESEYKMWNQYDYVVAVSESVANNFIKVFPKLEKKVIVIENILPINSIRKKAESEIQEFDLDAIKLLSIGRFASAKNFENIPDICKRLIDEGFNVKWYIIGYGPGEDQIRNKIKELGVEDNVIVIGKKENPYPYIKACDYYIQPSKYEGKSVTVREAQMFGKPVIITNYSTSDSQLKNGFDGIIVPIENESCAESIARLILDKDKSKELSSNCLKQDYSNKEEINKLYKMIK